LPEEKRWLSNWPEDVPRHITDYESIPVYEFLKRSARNQPDRKATVFYGRAITCTQLETLVGKILPRELREPMPS
jgi:long-chain acyl-CoA synthetase